MGILGLVTQACYIKGMAEGDAMVMAPIDYTRLVFAIILGYALFPRSPERCDHARRRRHHCFNVVHHLARSAARSAQA